MTIICPACGTENRDIAKFCIECVSTLPTRLGGLDYQPTALADATASRRQWTRTSTALLIVAVVGWVLAGAGGWYIYTFKPPDPAQSSAAAAAPPAATVLMQPAPVVPPAGVPPATSGSKPLQAPATEIKAEKAPARPALQTQAATTGAASGPASGRSASAIAPLPAQASAPAPAPAPVRRPDVPIVPRAAAAAATAPVEPDVGCTGLNFIAAAQCMAAQCARPEFAARAQCDVVRRQQRIDEEKRNPAMAN